MQEIYFLTKTSEIGPNNTVGVREVRRSRVFYSRTLRYGTVYKRSLSVICERTGRVDANGRDIYLTHEGIEFVYRHRIGSPTDLDSGRLECPANEESQWVAPHEARMSMDGLPADWARDATGAAQAEELTTRKENRDGQVRNH